MFLILKFTCSFCDFMKLFYRIDFFASYLISQNPTFKYYFILYYKKSYIHMHVTFEVNLYFDFYYIGLKIDWEVPKCYD